MRFIVQVLPIADDRADHPAPETKFHLKIDDDLTFADVLRLVEDRFKKNYAADDDCFFAKLQDLDGVDLLPTDQICDIFDSSTHKVNVIAVQCRRTRKRKEIDEDGDDEGLAAKRHRKDEEGYAIPKIPLQRTPGQLPPTSAKAKPNAQNLAQRAANRAALLLVANSQPEAVSGTNTSKSSLLTPESHQSQMVPTSAQRPPSSLDPTVQSSNSAGRNVAGSQGDFDMAVEDPIQDDDDDLFQFHGESVEDEELFEMEARSSAAKTRLTAFDRLRSSQEIPPSSARSQRSRQNRTPKGPWSHSEDEKLRAGIRKKIPIAQILEEFQIDRTESAARSRKRELKRMSSSALVPSSQLSQAVDGSDTDDGSRARGSKRITWTVDDVRKLRKGIANGFNSLELHSWFFPKRSQESVSKKFEREKESVYAFEEGKPDWPHDRSLVAGWCPLFNTQLRRGYRSGLNCVQIHQKYFSTYSEDTIRRKYNRYHNQMLRLRLINRTPILSNNLLLPSSQGTSQPAQSSPLVTRTTGGDGDRMIALRGAQEPETVMENTQRYPSNTPAGEEIRSSPPKAGRFVTSPDGVSPSLFAAREGHPGRNQNNSLGLSRSNPQSKIKFSSVESHRSKGKQPIRPPRTHITEELDQRFPKRTNASISSLSQSEHAAPLDADEEFVAGPADANDADQIDELVVAETQPTVEESIIPPTAPPPKSPEFFSPSTSDDESASSTCSKSPKHPDVFVKDDKNAGAQLSQELETHASKSRSQSETTPVDPEVCGTVPKTTHTQKLPKEHKGVIENSIRVECPTQTVENGWDDEVQSSQAKIVNIDDDMASQSRNPLTTRFQRVRTRNAKSPKAVEQDPASQYSNRSESLLEEHTPQPISASNSVIQGSGGRGIRTPVSGSSTGKLPRRLIPGSYAAEALRARMASRKSLTARQSMSDTVIQQHQFTPVNQQASESIEESHEKSPSVEKIPINEKDFWDAARHMATKKEDVPSVYKTLKGYPPGVLAMLAGDAEEAKAIHRKEVRARRDKAVEEGSHLPSRNTLSNQLLGPDDEAADEEIVRDDEEELKAFESDIYDDGPSEVDDNSDDSERNSCVDDTRHFSEVEDNDAEAEVASEAPVLPEPDVDNISQSNEVEEVEAKDSPEPSPRLIKTVPEAKLAKGSQVEVFDEDGNFIGSRPSTRDGETSVVPCIIKLEHDSRIEKFDEDSNLVDRQVKIHKASSPDIVDATKEEAESESDEGESKSEVEEPVTELMIDVDDHVPETVEEFPGREKGEFTPQFHRRQNAHSDRNPMLTDSMLPRWPSSGNVSPSNDATPIDAVSDVAVDGTQVASVATQSSGLDLPVIQSEISMTELSKSSKKRRAKRRKSEAGGIEPPSKKLKEENIKSSSPSQSSKLLAIAPPPNPVQPTTHLDRKASSDNFSSFTSTEGGSTRSKKPRNIRRKIFRHSFSSPKSASTSFDRTSEITNDANENIEPRSDLSKTPVSKTQAVTTPFASRVKSEPKRKLSFKPTEIVKPNSIVPPTEIVTPTNGTHPPPKSKTPIGPITSSERPSGWLSGLRGMLKTRGNVPKPQALNGTLRQKSSRGAILFDDSDDDDGESDREN